MDRLLNGDKKDEAPPPPGEGWWRSVLSEEPSRTQSGGESGLPSRPLLDRGSAADWQWARELYENDLPVELPVVDFNRGGLLVQAGGLRGFVPLSHVLELCREARGGLPPDLGRFVGRTLHLRVIEFDPERGRLVFSERAAQAEPGRRLELLRCLSPGDCVTGCVTNLTPFGAFVDRGGVEALIHVSEISWGRVRHPEDALAVGQTVEAIVLSTDPDNGRIALSLKALTPDPWADLSDRLALGDVVEGRATSIVKFGVFVEIEDGVEGLIHISEMNR